MSERTGRASVRALEFKTPRVWHAGNERGKAHPHGHRLAVTRIEACLGNQVLRGQPRAGMLSKNQWCNGRPHTSRLRPVKRSERIRSLKFGAFVKFEVKIPDLAVLQLWVFHLQRQVRHPAFSVMRVVSVVLTEQLE